MGLIGKNWRRMNSRDWDFVFGDLGNALADVKDWMCPPYPSWMPKWQREGRVSEFEWEDPLGDMAYEDRRDKQHEKGAL